MSTTSLATRAPALPRGLPAAAQAGLRMLRGLQHGQLRVDLPDGRSLGFGHGAAPSASLHLHDWNVFSAVLRSGDIGLAESYLAQQWSTPDLGALLKLLLANRAALDAAFEGRWWARLAHRLRHLLNRNTRAGSRRNIHAHYDLGNAFYALWLDADMNYSSAWFEGDLSGDLAQAQRAKLRLALRSAGVQPGARVLDIGCGWGALAAMAAGEYGARVTGVTLSTEQLHHARARLQATGLAERVELRLQDWRDIADEPFDAICSLEMVEAVGPAYWPAYFDSLRRLLKPGGRACVQSIVIRDDLFDRYLRRTDFIQQYIFPGGCLPSPARFRAEARRAGLRVAREFAFGRDYAETLRRWHQRFSQQRAEVLRLGFDERFIRLWEFYLSYCEAGFDMNSIDVMQYTLVREDQP